MKPPLFLIGGYLGVGKTTLIGGVLGRLPGRSAVVVSDFGPVGLDGKLLAAQGGALVVQEIPGGCVCCSVQDQLPQAVEAVLATGPDRVLVEPSGVARLGPLRDMLAGTPGVGEIHTLALVAVAGFEPEQMTPLLRDQLESADLWVLTHTSDATAVDRERLQETLASFYPPRPVMGAEDLLSTGWFESLVLPPNTPHWGGLDVAALAEEKDHHGGHDLQADGLTWPVEECFDFQGLLAFFAALAQGELGLSGKVQRAKGVFHTRHGPVLMEIAQGKVFDRPLFWHGPSQFDAVLQHPGPQDWDQLWLGLDARLKKD